MEIQRHHATAARAVERAYDSPQFEAGNIEFRIENDVIAIAGTNEAFDWLTNLRQFPWYCRGIGWMPAGYLKIGRRVHAEIMTQAYLIDLDFKYKHLAGHSAGGAIAMVVGCLLARSGIFVNEVITYGAPDIGRCRTLTKSVKVTQFLDGNDKVPLLTPWRQAVERTSIGDRAGFDHPISVYAEDLEAIIA